MPRSLFSQLWTIISRTSLWLLEFDIGPIHVVLCSGPSSTNSSTSLICSSKGITFIYVPCLFMLGSLDYWLIPWQFSMYFFINRFVFQYLKWGVFCIGFKRVQAEVKSAYQRILVEQKLEGQPNLSGEISFWKSVGRANLSDTSQSVKQKCQNLREISYKFLCCSSPLPIYITLTSTKFVAWIPYWRAI